MYSPDGRKEWYLDECRTKIYEESTAELIRRIFESTEQEEILFNKDVCDFTETEVIDLFKSYNSISRSRLRNNSWYLSRYHEWCYSNGLTQKIDNGFDDRTIIPIIKQIVPDEIILKKFYSEADIKKIIESEQDSINKFILLSLYCGIKGENLIDLVNLRIQDLNEITKTIKLKSGRHLKVDDFFINIMKMAYNTRQYINIGETCQHDYTKRKTYVKNDYIIRTCAANVDINDKNPVNAKFISNRIQKIKKNLNVDFISINSLYNSGLINYIKNKYQLKGISFKTALTALINKNYEYDKETQQYIEEYGSKKTARFLRMEILDIIDKL